MENRAELIRYLRSDGNLRSITDFDISGPHFKFVGEYTDLLKLGELIINGTKRQTQSENLFGLFRTYSIAELRSGALDYVSSEFLLAGHVIKQYKAWNLYPDMGEASFKRYTEVSRFSLEADWLSVNSGGCNRKVSMMSKEGVFKGLYGFTQILRIPSLNALPIYDPAYVFISEKKELKVINLAVHKTHYRCKILQEIVFKHFKVSAFVSYIRWKVSCKHAIQKGVEAYHMPLGIFAHQLSEQQYADMECARNREYHEGRSKRRIEAQKLAAAKKRKF